MEISDLVSIIIPCYNQAQYLEEAVHSVLNQTYPNIEIIIINDGSTDNTQDIAKKLQEKHPAKIKVISQVNSGVSEARNHGIRQSEGKYILALDADDLLDIKAVKQLVSVIIQYGIDIASPDLLCFGDSKDKITPVEFPKCNLLYQNCWVGPSMFKREVWEKNNGYKNNIEYEDWEFWINAYKNEAKFKRVHEVLCYYRIKTMSRFTESFKNDTYIKAKIVLFHPELYPLPYVKKAVQTIKHQENSANYYFYYSKDISYNTKNLFPEIWEFVSKNELKKQQIIRILDKNIGLYDLDVIENKTSIQKLYQETDFDTIIFYSSISYDIPYLQNYQYTWDKNRGIVKATGSMFPFVFKSSRENTKKQLIAYQRLLQYQTTEQQLILEKKTKILRNKEILIQEKDKLIENKNKIIAENINSLQKLHKEVNDTNNDIETLMSAIQEITKFPIKRNPIHKYEAYKIMLKTFHKLQRLKYAKK